MVTSKTIAAGISSQVKRFHVGVANKKALKETQELVSQSHLFAARLYTRQKIHMDNCPARLPMAAFVANSNPYSWARMNETGPVVSGRPINSPLTTGPQQRPAKVTVAINSGVINIL